MSEEVEPLKLPAFIKFLKREIENTNSPYKLKGYSMAADMLFTIASQKYHRIREDGGDL
jgi:hypothetical protein